MFVIKIKKQDSVNVGESFFKLERDCDKYGLNLVTRLYYTIILYKHVGIKC